MSHADEPRGGFEPLPEQRVWVKSACWLEDLGPLPGVQEPFAGVRTTYMEGRNPYTGIHTHSISHNLGHVGSTEPFLEWGAGPKGNDLLLYYLLNLSFQNLTL